MNGTPKQSFFSNIAQYLFYFFIVAIPINQAASVRLLVASLVFLLLTPARGLILQHLRNSFDIIFFYAVLLIGLLYTNELQDGIKVLETSVGFLLLAAAYPALTEKNQIEFKVFFYFCLGLLVACLSCLLLAYVNYNKSGKIETFFYYNLTEVIGSHPTYLAYYLIFAITFGLYLIFYKNTSISPYLTAAVVLFFFLVLMLTGGQTAFVSLMLVFSFFILKIFLDKRSSSHYLTGVLVITMLILMFAVTSLSKGRNNEILDDSWDRLTLWQSALQANTSPVFGVGTGDYKTVLNDYYRSHDLHAFATDSFNAHNQYIQIYLSNGLIGLAALLVLIARPLYMAVKTDNILGILTLFPFIIYGFTEVFLGRYQGVVFFALLHQIFITHYSSQKVQPKLANNV